MIKTVRHASVQLNGNVNKMKFLVHECVLELYIWRTIHNFIFQFGIPDLSQNPENISGFPKFGIPENLVWDWSSNSRPENFRFGIRDTSFDMVSHTEPPLFTYIRFETYFNSLHHLQNISLSYLKYYFISK